MWALGLVVGALLGAAAGSLPGAAFGGFVGLIAGLVIGRDLASRDARVAALEARVEELARDLAGANARRPAGVAADVAEATAGAALQARAADAMPAAAVEPPATPAAQAALRAVADAAQSSSQSPATASASAPSLPAAPLPVRKGGAGLPAAPATAAAASADDATADDARAAAAALAAGRQRPAWLAWLLGGNTLARMGVVILIIGVGFLLKFAAERVVVPIELRFAGVALGAIVLLVIGWRLRLSRPGYAMILQGGGVGVLYVTIFAALRLYALLPPTATFVLLFLVAAFSSWLAVRQDALSLAALGVVGGFLAPILTSTGEGNHVLLFAYYTLLNASILAIAWFRAWRVLNLIGFFFTFAVAIAWGFTRYRPEMFASTEPFLVVAFLFYVAVAVLYAIRQSVALKSYIDATLVFATPLVVAGLQSGLVRDKPFAMAMSALFASALYLALARLLYARKERAPHMLVEAFLALGVIFATLAIPLALDARWTSATWALEGAALAWVGVRQQRLGARLFGVLLQLAAGTALVMGAEFWRGSAPPDAIAVLNRDCIGALLMALSGLATAWFIQRAAFERRGWERVVAPAMLAWGTAWWLFAGGREIDRWFPAELRDAALIDWLTLTALAFAVAERALRWPVARVPALGLLPLLLLVALGNANYPHGGGEHLFAHGGYLAWPLAVLAVLALLRHWDTPAASAGPAIRAPLEWWHAGLLWLVVLIAGGEFAWLGSRVNDDHGTWSVVAWGLVGAAALFAAASLADKPWWPMRPHRVGYLVFAATPVAIALSLWLLAANVGIDGDPRPLPYLPLLNPLDITQGLALLALATWALKLRGDGARLAGLSQPAVIGGVLAALAFVWINGVVLRTIHFGYDVAYTPHALWGSRLVQAALSLLWSALALATMVFANRRRLRIAWTVGAVMLAVVVVKLFVVDLSQVGGVERIVSFIGVGLLLLLIGFLAPVPPRRVEVS